MCGRLEGEMGTVWMCIGASESCWLNVDVSKAASSIRNSISTALVAPIVLNHFPPFVSSHIN